MILRKKTRVKMYRTSWHKLTLFIVITSMYSKGVHAQEEKSDCVIKLEQAQSKYNQGRIQDIEPLIGDCLQSKEFDKTSETQALKLLALSYLFLEEPEKAGETMLQLLHANHLFAINPAIDPSEFINLYEKYRHDPLFSLGFLGGLVAAKPIVIASQLNSTQDLNNDNRQKYSPLINFRVGANAEYKLKEKIYLVAALNFSFVKFQKTHSSTRPITNTSTAGVGFEGIEAQSSIELPLLVQYHIAEANKLTPYVAVGVAPQLLLNASYPGETITNTIEGSPPATSQNIDLTQDRNRFNLNIMAVGGLKYKINEGFLNIQLRYSYGILQSSKETSALTPTNPNLIWDLSESSDGFRLHDIGISIGYTFDIYVPKKLR